jgi:RHS repeat-associated protein
MSSRIRKQFVGSVTIALFLSISPVSAQEVSPGGGGGSGSGSDSGSSDGDEYRSITDLSTFDQRSVVAVAPGVPEGSLFAGFENNEQVQLYNGNLLVSHNSSVAYPLNGGGALNLSRVYNSMNVIDRQVTPTALMRSLRVARGDSGAIEAGVSSVADQYPYGQAVGSSVAMSERVFAGLERDTGSGADYALARYDHSSMARFLSVDPVSGEPTPGRAQRWNLYAYSSNNPENRLDPDGRIDDSFWREERSAGHWKNAGGMTAHEGKQLAKVAKGAATAGSGVAVIGAIVAVVGAIAANPIVAAVGVDMMIGGGATSIAFNGTALALGPTTQNAASLATEIAIQATTGGVAGAAAGSAKLGNAFARGSLELEGAVLGQAIQGVADELANPEPQRERVGEGSSAAGSSAGSCSEKPGSACSLTDGALGDDTTPDEE